MLYILQTISLRSNDAGWQEQVILPAIQSPTADIIEIIRQLGLPITLLLAIGYVSYKVLLPFVLKQIESNQELMRENLKEVTEALKTQGHAMESQGQAMQAIKRAIESIDNEIKKPKRR